ncbi:MAG TPA: DUF4199 domain-containing protein [Pyrinomonadaceae bacterium]|nr:DUF4199 domain-containing protein [Pyrinomonadaceae bacterium]
MKKTVLTFGLIGGVMMSVLMLGTIPFIKQIGFERAELVGYTTMIASFLMVFFGIRSYRENVGFGRVTFRRAFAVGALITLIISVFYVLTWQIMYFNFMPNFVNDYAAYLVEKMRASGATPEAIEAKLQEMREFKKLYDNPLLNAAITLIEPIPVGLLLSLISSFILRKKGTDPPAVEANERMAG